MNQYGSRIEAISTVGHRPAVAAVGLSVTCKRLTAVFPSQDGAACALRSIQWSGLSRAAAPRREPP